jgi:flagellar hook-associated protein 2
MAGVSMGTGLVSGIDYTTMISQLMSIEAQPQTLLKNQLTNAQTDASAYRKVNTAVAALSSAAQAITGSGLTSSRRASSNSSTAAASAGATAVPGSSVTFTVDKLAAAQVSVSAGTWSSATADLRTSTVAGSPALPTLPLTVQKADGTPAGQIDVPAGGSLNDLAAAINKSSFGLSAAVIQLDSSHFKLQVTSNATGANGAFQLLAPGEAADSTYATPGAAFTSTTKGTDAQITLSTGDVAKSSSNTFSELLTGVSVTVSALSPIPTGSTTPTPTTITVSNDTSAVTGKVQSLIDAANAALSAIHDATDSSDGSDAPLKGNWALTNLANNILSQVSGAVGGKSPSTVGIQLDKDGNIVFDATAFSKALAADPTLTQTIVGGSTGAGADNVDHSPDDTIDVDGIAARLSVLGEQASDSATGMITSLANSQDNQAKDLQSQIDDWTLRLQQRQDTLTAQFNAMETALGTLQSQGSWLTSQINALPKMSSS